jgi:sugar O-acyltransferase (sialic acid O-acetyltransferase NeuD family)
MKKILIIGDNEFAEIASVYFSKDYGYETVAFAVERRYLKRNELIGIPVVAYEDITKLYNPSEYGFFAAPVYTQLNRLRQRFYEQCKEWGYEPVKYVSPHAFVWENAHIGENTFIFEGNVIQYNVKIGNNVILWSGNHVGHSAVIEDNCFVSSHVVISGYTKIGKNSFLGVNSTLGNNIEFPADSILAAGAVTSKSFSDIGSIYAGNPARKMSKTAYEYCGIEG